MGTIAKIGIVSGRAVPLEAVPGHPGQAAFTDFSRGCLSRFGFARIADRVVAGLPLGIRDVEMLLSKASLPVLMKLVELRHGGEDCVQPMPLVMLPLSNWAARYEPTRIVELSHDLLKSIRHKHIRVVIDEIDFEKLDGELFAVLREIAHCRPGLTLVGPPVDDVVSWVLSAGSSKGIQSVPRFEQLLHKLRSAGLGRLMPSSAVEVLKTVKEAGFPASLVTNIPSFATPLELAKELLRVNEIAAHQPIDVWVPGADPLPASKRTGTSALDFQVLRTLAVGSLCMPAVPYRRASTRYLSVEAIQFSRHCGANDFGFGAVNELTARALHLEKLDRLRRAVGNEPERAVAQRSPFPLA